MKLSRNRKDSLKLSLNGLAIGFTLCSGASALNDGNMYIVTVSAIVIILLIILAKFEIDDQVERIMERFKYKGKDV